MKVTVEGKILPVSVMDEKGRVVIPKKIRSKINAREFAIELTDDGMIILHPVG